MVEDDSERACSPAQIADAITASQQSADTSTPQGGDVEDNTKDAQDQGTQLSKPTANPTDYEELYRSAPIATVAQTYQLTRREQEVLGLLARGHSFSAMEEKLCISHNTMKTHARNIYTKMEVHNRQDVISMVDLIRAKQLGEAGSKPPSR